MLTARRAAGTSPSTKLARDKLSHRFVSSSVHHGMMALSRLSSVNILLYIQVTKPLRIKVYARM